MRKISVSLLLALAACSESEAVDQPSPEPAREVAQPAESEDLPNVEIEIPEDFSNQFEPARAAIDDFCGDDAACVRDQRENLARFVKIMVGFDDPGQAVAGRCMRSGKVDEGIDWSVAGPCMQAAAKGKALGARLD